MMTPARLGVAASAGRERLAVIARPELAIVPTGDELVEPAVKPGPGQIRNSNAIMLAGLSRQAGASVRTLPIARDERENLEERLADALESDLVLVTGGVSAGRLDLVPETLERLGVSRIFHKISLKPGKPLWFGIGKSRGEKPGPLVFGLPGNPVSGLVGFVLFVRPAIQGMLEWPTKPDRTIETRLSRPFVHSGDRPTYHPARRIEGSEAGVEPLDWAGSADLRTVASADGFVVFPAGDRQYEAGEIVRFLALK
jgi:molybdopterin molybdotransferase